MNSVTEVEFADGSCKFPMKLFTGPPSESILLTINQNTNTCSYQTYLITITVRLLTIRYASQQNEYTLHVQVEQSATYLNCQALWEELLVTWTANDHQHWFVGPTV